MHPQVRGKPLVCRTLVGRQHELHEFSGALQRAGDGQPQLLLLAGEAGVGKTKLCRSFIEMSQEQAIPVVCGQAIRQDMALAFGPFMDAFRRYFAVSGHHSFLSDSSLQAAFSPFVRFLPGLASFLPTEVSSLPGNMSTPVQQQQALFHNVLSGLQSLAQAHQRPLLLLLEDLHWADETSLDLLAFLAQRFEMPVPQREGTLLIVGTYRTGALAESPALQRLLVQLRQQRLVCELPLASLSVTEHWQCLCSILEQVVPEEFANVLFAWSEGNPFFTEELLGSMVASGQLQLAEHTWLIPPHVKLQLPTSLRSAILERFAQLPGIDREVVAYAAVLGRSFDFPLLAALSGVNERELVEVLSRAVRVQLIGEVSSTPTFRSTDYEPERYQFRHALTREAIYDQMLASERRLRHRTVAQTLEKLISDTPDATASLTRRGDVTRLLTEHYWHGGVPEKACKYALEEAKHAAEVFAFHEERYYLDLAQANLPEYSFERLQLLERLAMLSLLVFDIADAQRWLALFKAGYQHSGQAQQAVLAMAKMFLISLMLGTISIPNFMVEIEALAEVAFQDSISMNEDVDLLQAYSLIALYHTLDCQHQRAILWTERAISLFTSLANSQKEGTLLPAYLARSWIKLNGTSATAEAGLAEVRTVLETARQQSLPDNILWSYSILVTGLLCWGRTNEAGKVLEEMSIYGLRAGIARPQYPIGWQRFFAAEQWEQTIEQIREEVHRATEQIQQANLPLFAYADRVVLAHFLLAKHELTEAQTHLEAAQPALEAYNIYSYLVLAWWGLAKFYTLQNAKSQAQGEYERILKHWRTTGDTCLILPILLDGIVFYTDTYQPARAKQWFKELQQVVQRTNNPVGVAACWEAQGVLHAQEGALEPAMDALRHAVHAWGQVERPYQQALASYRLAELLLLWAERQSVEQGARRAAREEAEMLLDQTMAVYERLQIPGGKAAVQALRSRTHLEAQRKRRSTLQARQPFGNLTQREMQVLVHLAAGRTNREIATALSMSVGTAGLHVSHILSKLDCATRTQAATYATAQGWLK